MLGGTLPHSHHTQLVGYAVTTHRGRWSVKCCGCDGCRRWPPHVRWGWTVSSCCHHQPCPALCRTGCRRCAPACRSLHSHWSSSACCAPPIATAGWREKKLIETDLLWWRGDVTEVSVTSSVLYLHFASFFINTKTTRRDWWWQVYFGTDVW